jgi:PAS domain S-box-containing protein
MLHHEGLRRRAEEELRQSRARVGALVNDHPGLICRFRRDGTLTFVNPAYSKMFGRSADELIGTSFLDLIPPGDRDAVQANIDSLGHENPTVTYVHRAIGAAGEIHWQEWTDRALFDDRGNIVEYQSAGRDITAERATQQALRDSEEMLSAMMEAISDALVVMDERGHVAFWNTSAEKILGHRREDAIGHDVHDLIARPTDAQSFRLALPHFADTGSGPVIGQMLELAAKRADGSEFPVELSVNSFRFRDRWHAVGIMRDISDRKELERRLWQSEKMEALGNLAGGIAHDVNNMLQPVIGFAAMLHADFPEESPERSHAGIILQAAQRIKALVERILAFSRKEDVKLQVFDLAQAMREGLDMARSMTPTNITIDTQIDGRVNTIVADPSQMQAILLNLVANAVDAIGPRPGTISVKLRRRVADAGLIEVFPDLKEGNDYVWIEVADTGCGIDANSLTRVFDPFYTTKPAGEGTGLGLSIVHGLVTKFGGAITVDSVVGRGTRFTIYLPLAPRSLFS